MIVFCHEYMLWFCMPQKNPETFSSLPQSYRFDVEFGHFHFQLGQDGFVRLRLCLKFCNTMLLLLSTSTECSLIYNKQMQIISRGIFRDKLPSFSLYCPNWSFRSTIFDYPIQLIAIRLDKEPSSKFNWWLNWFTALFLVCDHVQHHFNLENRTIESRWLSCDVGWYNRP